MSSRFRRLWLLTCLTLLAGLTTVVPVNCLCEANQHWGQTVHPLFEHHHVNGHHHGVVNDSSPPTLGFHEGFSFTVSEHGSFMGAVFDGMISGTASVWLTLQLFPLLTLLPMVRRMLVSVSVAPPAGPPRARPLFN